MQSKNKAGLRIVTLALLIGATLAGVAPGKAAAATPCATMITACGCTIQTSGIYTLNADLFATSAPDCIDIAKDHAILNLQGHRIIGRNDGTGIGIHILASADHVIVEGGNEKENDPPQNPSNGEPVDPASNHQGVVAQWNIGIQDDGNDAVIELFNVIGFELLLPKSYAGNATAGVFLNHVSNSVIGDFRANGNGKYGVELDHCSNIEIGNITTQGNGDTGVLMADSSNNHLGPATSSANEKFGTYVLVSNFNVIHDDALASNSDTGIVIGCRNLDKKNCPGNQQSNDNRLVNSGATGNKKAGVVITKHSGRNIITVNHNDGNGGKQMDMVDENGKKCGTNIWYNNTGSANESCIH